MSETATAVEGIVTEAIGAPAPAPTDAAAPAVVRREEVRDRIINSEWKDEAALAAARDGEATPAPDGEAGLPEGEAPAPEAAAAEEDVTEPPAEAVLDDGAGRIFVRSADGKFTPAPDVKLEFAVGDKVYLKTPAELVRMARDGVAGQYFAQEVKQYREQVPQLRQQLETIAQELEAQAALNRELLEDEAAYYDRRAQWQQLNSPEQQLARLQQERQQELETRRAYEEQAQRTHVVQAYYQQELKPVQDELLNGFPQVALEAKLGRISMDTMPLLQNGVIPPHRLPEYKAYLDGPFRQWVQAEAARLEQGAVAREKAAQQSLEAERRRAQQVVQSVGKQMAPAGKAAPDTPPPPRKPRNREEAKAMIIGRPFDG